jgi:hypothetical protein
MVPAGSPWLTYVILGYPWLSVDILGYTWLSTIQIYVKSLRICNYLSRHLQKSSAVAAPPERLKGKGASDSPNIYDLNRRNYTH